MRIDFLLLVFPLIHLLESSSDCEPAPPPPKRKKPAPKWVDPSASENETTPAGKGKKDPAQKMKAELAIADELSHQKYS